MSFLGYSAFSRTAIYGDKGGVFSNCVQNDTVAELAGWFQSWRKSGKRLYFSLFSEFGERGLTRNDGLGHTFSK